MHRPPMRMAHTICVCTHAETVKRAPSTCGTGGCYNPCGDKVGAGPVAGPIRVDTVGGRGVPVGMVEPTCVCGVWVW